MKICRICRQEKALENFPWKNKERGTYNTACKPCQREYGRQSYRDNPERYKQNSKKNRASYVERNREYIINHLKSHPCMDCGESDIIVLEFDHREPLLKTGFRMSYYMSASLDRLIEKINKCDVVCSNCHTRRTARMFGWKRLDYI